MWVSYSPKDCLWVEAEVSVLGHPGFLDSSQQGPSCPLERSQAELFRQHSAAGQNHFSPYEKKMKGKYHSCIRQRGKYNITMATEEWI